MADNILSVFIDESGDFGPLDRNNPYYHVTLVFHEQSYDISELVQNLDEHIVQLNFPIHAIHTGPIIRREGFYECYFMNERQKLFNSILHFTRKLDVSYLCPYIDKTKCRDDLPITYIGQLSKQLSECLKQNIDYLSSFDTIIVYYDNGQTELTKIITSVFNALFSQVEFRKVTPLDYKLFQVADLICTTELIHKKAENNLLSKSELEFFHSIRDFNKNIYKNISKKKLNVK